jgi:diacylglycerol kinase (ATP)
MPGVSPFWGVGPGRIRLTTIDCPPRRLLRAILPVLRGEPKPWMEKAGYLGRRVDRIELTIKSPIVIDGEIFAPPESGSVSISAGPIVRFLRF